MVRPKSTTITTNPPSTSAIGNQFERSRTTFVDNRHQTSTPTGPRGIKVPSSDTRRKLCKTRTGPSKSIEALLYTDYSLFESKRRPKSADLNKKLNIAQYPVPTSKSMLLETRSQSPQLFSPTPQRRLAMTLTPKTVTPTLTKYNDCKQRPLSETRRQVFTCFKPKSTIHKFDEAEPNSLQQMSRSNHPDARMMVPRTYSSTRNADEGRAGPNRQASPARPKSARELFCNCSSGQPKLNVKYPANGTSWKAYTNGQYDLNRITLWSTQGLHWIHCSGGDICSRAVEGGHTRSGEPLYIARALTPDGTKALGTFHLPSGVCYIPWKGRDIATDRYELLCYRSRIQAPVVLDNDTPTLNLVDTLKVLTLRNRRTTTF